MSASTSTRGNSMLLPRTPTLLPVTTTTTTLASAPSSNSKNTTNAPTPSSPVTSTSVPIESAAQFYGQLQGYFQQITQLQQQRKQVLGQLFHAAASLSPPHSSSITIPSPSTISSSGSTLSVSPAKSALSTSLPINLDMQARLRSVSAERSRRSQQLTNAPPARISPLPPASPNHKARILAIEQHEGEFKAMFYADTTLFQSLQELYLQFLSTPPFATQTPNSNKPIRLASSLCAQWLVTNGWCTENETNSMMHTLEIVGVLRPVTDGKSDKADRVYDLIDPQIQRDSYMRNMQQTLKDSSSSTGLTNSPSHASTISPLSSHALSNTTSISNNYMPMLITWQLLPLVKVVSIILTGIPQQLLRCEQYNIDSSDWHSLLDEIHTNISYLIYTNQSEKTGNVNSIGNTHKSAAKKLVASRNDGIWKRINKPLPGSSSTSTIQSTNLNDMELYMMERCYAVPNNINASVGGSYTSLLRKCYCTLPCSPMDYIMDMCSDRRRKKWEPLFASCRTIEQIDEQKRVVHISTKSPVPYKVVKPRDCVLYQEWYQDGSTYVFYELSVSHPAVPSIMPGYQRATVFCLLRVLHAIPPSAAHKSARSRLLLLAQVDLNDNATEDWHATWLERWIGQPSNVDLALALPSTQQLQTLQTLPHSPAIPGILATSTSSHSLLSSPSQFTSTADALAVSVDTKLFDATALLTHEDHFAQPVAAQTNSTTPAPIDNSMSPSPSTSTLPTPTVDTAVHNDPNYIPEFQALSVLGRGAYSKILQVRDKQSGNLYAMKVLRKHDVVQIGHQSHILTEQSILARLNHPFICHLFYAFQSEQKLYMVMSYAAGGDLFSLIRRGRMSEYQVAFYMAELICALRYIHKHGIIHRDVKPENILICHDGHVLLCDFGLSHQLQMDENNGGYNAAVPNRTYSLSGTSEYLSPEMIIHTQGHTYTSDYWQLGIVMHEMLSGGIHPFYHKNLYRMQQNILYHPPHISDHISPLARSLLLQLLNKDGLMRIGQDIVHGDIEQHPFFQFHGFTDFAALQQKLIPAPYVPAIDHPTDVSHFDQQFTQQMPAQTPDSCFNSLVNASSYLPHSINPRTQHHAHNVHPLHTAIQEYDDSIFEQQEENFEPINTNTHINRNNSIGNTSGSPALAHNSPMLPSPTHTSSTTSFHPSTTTAPSTHSISSSSHIHPSTTTYKPSSRSNLTPSPSPSTASNASSQHPSPHHSSSSSPAQHPTATTPHSPSSHAKQLNAAILLQQQLKDNARSKSSSSDQSTNNYNSNHSNAILTRTGSHGSTTSSTGSVSNAAISHPPVSPLQLGATTMPQLLRSRSSPLSGTEEQVMIGIQQHNNLPSSSQYHMPSNLNTLPPPALQSPYYAIQSFPNTQQHINSQQHTSPIKPSHQAWPIQQSNSPMLMSVQANNSQRGWHTPPPRYKNVAGMNTQIAMGGGGIPLSQSNYYYPSQAAMTGLPNTYAVQSDVRTTYSPHALPMPLPIDDDRELEKLYLEEPEEQQEDAEQAGTS